MLAIATSAARLLGAAAWVQSVFRGVLAICSCSISGYLQVGFTACPCAAWVGVVPEPTAQKLPRVMSGVTARYFFITLSIRFTLEQVFFPACPQSVLSSTLCTKSHTSVFYLRSVGL